MEEYILIKFLLYSLLGYTILGNIEGILNIIYYLLKIKINKKNKDRDANIWL